MEFPKEYLELLRFPSVGVDPAHFKDCLDCAAWWKKWLKSLGFTADFLYPEPKVDVSSSAAIPPPVVFAERPGSPDAPTVLVYGHYDVQPAAVEDGWNTPPFEPTVIGDRVFCRGAQDDKGQTFALMCGLKNAIDAGAKVPTVKILLDGQEESGSAALTRIAPTIRQKIAADILLVCDTSAAADLRPAIVAGLRGVGHFTVRITGPNRDLHSGEYGGVAPNPAAAIARLLATLHNPDGSIAVAGFRDGIIAPDREELRLAETSTPDEAGFAADIGCEPTGGQLGKSVVQRVSFEPTIEINGIHSGWGGNGSKTVIPAEAIAKISMRLVPGQIPSAAFDAVKRHLEDHLPRGLKLSFEEIDIGAPALKLPLASPLFRLAEDILSEMDPRGPVFMWDGASIPILSVLKESSGAAPLIVGWGQSEDRIHSPNESYSLKQFSIAADWGRRLFSFWS